MENDTLTFGLALVGYVLLAADATRRWRGGRSPGLTWLTAAVIVAHVLCVWAFRFDWSFADMWTKSIPGFVIFHGAFALILTSLVAPEPVRTRLIYAAFVIVCTGALPAPFRYDEISLLRIPMIVAFGAAVWLAFGPTRRSC